ncbi:hypothetical protein [Vibrio kanaloae]|uniref:hypothetical protein n=1 Tax=Vibrio kanaloae TaxID=170673 RepID=UPI0011154BCE|nr:hypothetical protein [Vibrio kanaloae]QPK06281.1 hypothetical protein BTD91_20590 [Vibrio kanaloae]
MDIGEIMRVFAEYYLDDDLQFRRNTLLKIGTSWDLIGNIVLANPGSAEPISDVNNDSLCKVEAFYGKYRSSEQFELSNWKEFSPDPTMVFIEKLFKGDYIGESRDLNGVIQLFNTFNIKNQNLGEAVRQISTESKLIFSYGIEKYFHDCPTYFGFSNAVLNNTKLRSVAETIFENSSEKVKKPYDSKFSNNKFYHPMYINKAYKQVHFQKFRDSMLVPFAKNA